MQGRYLHIAKDTMTTLINISILVVLAVLSGSMVFFSLVMAPLIFIKLDAPVAGRFIRSIFPWYYLLIIVLAALGAALMANQSLGLALVLVAVSLLGLYLRLWLLPHINRLRDKQLGGDAADQVRYDASHRLSVWINGLQLILVFAVLVLFALALN